LAARANASLGDWGRQNKRFITAVGVNQYTLVASTAMSIGAF